MHACMQRHVSRIARLGVCRPVILQQRVVSCDRHSLCAGEYFIVATRAAVTVAFFLLKPLVKGGAERLDQIPSEFHPLDFLEYASKHGHYARPRGSHHTVGICTLWVD